MRITAAIFTAIDTFASLILACVSTVLLITYNQTPLLIFLLVYGIYGFIVSLLNLKALCTTNMVFIKLCGVFLLPFGLLAGIFTLCVRQERPNIDNDSNEELLLRLLSEGKITLEEYKKLSKK